MKKDVSIGQHYHEITCPSCDGCGLKGSKSIEAFWMVDLCAECNGHGIVLERDIPSGSESSYFEKPKRKAYSITWEVQCKFTN